MRNTDVYFAIFICAVIAFILFAIYLAIKKLISIHNKVLEEMATCSYRIVKLANDIHEMDNDLYIITQYCIRLCERKQSQE